jgi:hypothetical protein
MVLLTNRQIEDAAVSWVMSCERMAGRQPSDTRHSAAAADIESPPRTIEIKAFGLTARGQDLWLEPRQVSEAQQNDSFYLYVVENVRQGDPEFFSLKVLDAHTIRTLLSQAREKHYYEVPWPTAAYDSLAQRPREN